MGAIRSQTDISATTILAFIQILLSIACFVRQIYNFNTGDGYTPTPFRNIDYIQQKRYPPNRQLSTMVSLSY